MSESQPPEGQPQNPPSEPTPPPAYPAYPGESPAGGFSPPLPQGYPAQHAGGTQRFANWGERVGAFIVDIIPGAAFGLIGGAIFGDPFTVTTDSADQVHFESSGSSIVIIYGIGILWAIVNWVYLQGKTGQTIGKKALGIAVYRAGTTEPIGYGLAVGRYFARFLDIIPCYLGLLWPLWDNENRTFADMICGTRVYKI
ncbi:MAG: hypothetical protein JWQ70_1650 [Aeromicrobium sp.]|nr:hypothetical protein [Aeromicrobium sp.]